MYRKSSISTKLTKKYESVAYLRVFMFCDDKKKTEFNFCSSFSNCMEADFQIIIAITSITSALTLIVFFFFFFL